MFRADALRPQGGVQRLWCFAHGSQSERKVIQTASQVGMHGAKAFLACIHGTAEVALGPSEVTLLVSKLSEVIQGPRHTPVIRARFLSKFERAAIVFNCQG